MKKKAIIERIEDGIATLELTDKSIAELPIEKLADCREGDVVEISFDAEGDIADISKDAQATEARASLAKSRLKRLFNKKS